MICDIADSASYCERHKRVHGRGEIRLALDPSAKGEKYRDLWDAWLRGEFKAKHATFTTAKLVRCSPCSEKMHKDIFLKVGPEMHIDNALKLINEPPGTLNHAWKVTAEAYTIEIGRRAEAAKAEVYPEGKFAGRGIVVGAGGVKFFGCAWVCVSMLRWLGCNLPVEFWFLGRGEMDPQMAELAKRLDVTVVDARAVAAALPVPPRILNGWELKPFSVLHSRFEEVTYLDADCIPVQNPEKLFESAEYLETGAIFWPDLAPNDGRKEWIPPVVWERCGMTPRNYVDFESGQVVVDKRRCWDAMLLTQWMNEHSDYWYKMVFGDKTTWHLCWQKLERKYSMPIGACGWQWPAIIQHDFQGHSLFVHCVRGKEDLCAANLMKVPLADKMQDAGRVLSGLWRRRIWDHQDETSAEQHARTMTAGRFRYVRVGLGERMLELLPDGSIGVGAAGCEKRWTLRILDGVPTIVVLGESHKGSEVGMMFLAKGGDGVWRGAWEFHERCLVELHHIIDTAPPSYFNFRPGTWDRDIYDCVVRDNEYRLPPSFGPDDVIVDIGAHIGSFSHACLIRGAGKVLCVEPHPENFAMLMGNLATKYATKIRPFQAALSPLQSTVSIGPFPGPNTGGAGMCDLATPGAVAVPAVNLFEVLRLAGPGEIRLLKFDCEGSEWAWLLTSTVFENVEEIVAELHTGPDWESKTRELAEHMREIGFDPQIELRSQEHGLGYLFAKRQALPPTPSRRVLVQMATGDHLRLLELAEPHHLAYAQRHGMEYRSVRGSPCPRLPPSWGKVKVILDLFREGFDQVVWLDADAVIVDTERDITRACSKGVGMVQYERPFPHFQAGVLVCHCSPEVIRLLEDVLASAAKNPGNTPGEFGQWEQTPLNVLGTQRDLIEPIPADWNCVPEYIACGSPAVLAAHGAAFPARLNLILDAVMKSGLTISRVDRLAQLRSVRRFNDDDSWVPPGREAESAAVNSVTGLLDLLAETGPLDSVLEVGSHRGVSTEAFLLHAEKVVSVDPARDPSRFRWLEKTYGPKLEMVNGCSPQALAGMKPGLLDLVYIDAYHDYASAKADILAALPLIRAGGWISGHDHSDLVPGAGVVQAVRELFGERAKVFGDSSWLVKLHE